MKDKETTIGHLLRESLTKDQIACMLEVVASAWDLKSLMDEFMRADPDMAATVGEVLKEVRAKTDWKTKSRPVSHKRTMEYWNSLWRQWHEILADIGDEEGKYAAQDHHWEEPYFDGFQLACDIEPIAQEMLGLIDDVYASVEDPNLFVGALEEIEAGIASYPEWMGAEYGEPVELDKNATSCVLKWFIGTVVYRDRLFMYLTHFYRQRPLPTPSLTWHFNFFIRPKVCKLGIRECIIDIFQIVVAIPPLRSLRCA